MGEAPITWQLQETARSLRAWLSHKDPASLPRLIGLANAPVRSWQELAHHAADVMTLETVEQLSASAYAFLGREAATAVALARLATRAAEFIALPTQDSGPSFAEAAGEAWRVYAHALFKIGEFQRATDAGHHSEFFLGLEPLKCMYQLALLRLTQGLVLHELGDSVTALRLIDGSAHILFGWCDNKKKYVEARIIYAAVLMESGRVDEALEVYDDTATLAEEDGDTERLAYILNNVGGCRARLGQFAEAHACFDIAMQAFTHLGLTGEVPRVRTAKARALIQEGRTTEAISELYLCRAEFLVAGAPVVAATVSLWIVDQKLLLDPTADVRWLCEEMVRTFQQADLPRQARIALAYLRDLSRDQAATREHITHVQEFMEALQDSPGAMFVPL